MNQKYFIVLFCALMVIGVGMAGADSVKKGLSPETTTPTPTKTVQEELFSSGQKAQQTNQQAANQQIAGQQTRNTSTQMENNKKTKEYSQFPGVLAPEEIKGKKAVIETDKGVIEFEIYPEATKSASNFVFLAKDNFYNGLTFHRVEPGFVIQGGDPAGDGTGGPGYTYKEDKIIGKYDKGIVAMAKRADEPAGTGGSQFFIMLADTSLPPQYAIFGKVITGQDVVEKIKAGDIMKKVSITALK